MLASRDGPAPMMATGVSFRRWWNKHLSGVECSMEGFGGYFFGPCTLLLGEFAGLAEFLRFESGFALLLNRKPLSSLSR